MLSCDPPFTFRWIIDSQLDSVVDLQARRCARGNGDVFDFVADISSDDDRKTAA